MKLWARRRIDWFLGFGLVIMLAPLARMVGLLLRRNHSLLNPREIVVLKLLGGGNFAIALPMLLGLRQRYPAIPLLLITTRSLRPFADALGLFDKILEIDDSTIGGLFRGGLKALLIAFRVDCILDMEVHSKLATCFCLFTCARNRIGFYTEDFFLRKFIHTHLVFYNFLATRASMYTHMGRLLDAKPASWEQCKMQLLSLLAPQIPAKQGRTLALGVGCSDNAKERMLTVEQWEAVFQERFLKLGAERVILFGGKADAGLAQSLITSLKAKFSSSSFVNACGEYSLVNSLAIMSTCDIFWGIDSALLHFARALGIESLSFWGPTRPDTRILSIPGLKEEIIYKGIACSPCVHMAETPPCCGNNLCIKQYFSKTEISEIEVLQNITFRGFTPPKE